MLGPGWCRRKVVFIQLTRQALSLRMCFLTSCFHQCQDDDPVGETRQVLVLGADLQKDEPAEEMPPVHPYADVGRKANTTSFAESDDDGPPRLQPYSVKSRPHEQLEPPPRVRDLPETPPVKAEPKKPPAPKPKPPPPPPEEYEIIIKHAVEAGEVPVKIWSNWTFGAVRDALARKLQRDLKKARFVFKAGTGTAPWIAFKDGMRTGMEVCW